MRETFTDLGPWYQNLQRPSWQPPDWAFGPAWTAIFALMVMSGVSARNATSIKALRQRILVGFGANALLNILWSSLFFTFRRPDWALVEVCLLWLSVAALIALLAPISRRAPWLLAPYLAWVTFAGALSLAVARLNEPF